MNTPSKKPSTSPAVPASYTYPPFRDLSGLCESTRAFFDPPRPATIRDVPQAGLSARQVAIIDRVLAAIPEVERAYVFGSRALGTHRLTSDLDLAIDGTALDERSAARVRLAFEEDYLPYSVDVVSLPLLRHTGLHAHIEAHGVLLWQRGA